MEEDRPRYSFETRPPGEVADFLRAKTGRVSFDFRDVEHEEHAVAFTVAKAGQVEVLDAIREEVQRAIDEGRTLADFRRDLEPRLRDLGWWGRQTVTDPETGETREVQLGSPRRLRTIYRANLRAARAAGQWSRIERTADVLPYLLYLLGPSRRHRPAHAAQEGTVRRWDDPWWDFWMPPNGWGCRCHVRQVGQAEAERRGIEPTVTPATVEHRNPRTGEVRRVPPGVDPAWAGNPGKERRRNVERHLRGELDAADPAIARAAIADILDSWRMTRLLAAGADDAAAFGAVPVALAPEAAASAAGAAGQVVELDAATAVEIRARVPDIARADWGAAQAALDAGMADDGEGRLSGEVDLGGRRWRVTIGRRDGADPGLVLLDLAPL